MPPKRNFRQLGLRVVDVNGTLARYYESMEAVTHNYPRLINVEPFGQHQTLLMLTCRVMNNDRPGHGFCSCGDGSYQYRVRLSDGTDYRPKAYRVAMVNDARFLDNGLTVSHLCHFNNCYHPGHVCLETIQINQAREGCSGGRACGHWPRCIIPGPNAHNGGIVLEANAWESQDIQTMLYRDDAL